MEILNTKECFSLLKDFDVPESIVKHSQTVNKISLFLADRLIKRGERINLKLLNAATLLHDLDKFSTLDKQEAHGKMAEKTLSEKGYPEIGKIIGIHSLHILERKLLVNWERKLLCYSDLRAQGSTLVSMNDRFKDLIKRYPDKVDLLRNAKEIAIELEKEIFFIININPDEVIIK